MDELFTIAEAAAMLNLDPSLVRRYCRNGKLPAKQLGGWTWMIARKDAERFVSAPPGNPAFRKKRKPKKK